MNSSYQPFWGVDLVGVVGDIFVQTCNYPDHFNPSDIVRIADETQDGLVYARYQRPVCGRVYYASAQNPN